VSDKVRERVKETKRAEKDEREAVMFMWLGHLSRCMNVEKPSNKDIEDWMDLIADEMRKTNFINWTGFENEEVQNDFGDLMDDEMQDFVMHYGGGDNNLAYQFVLSMQQETLRKIGYLLEAEEGDSVGSDRENNAAAAQPLDCEEDEGVPLEGVTDKTQTEQSPASNEAKGKSVTPDAGRVCP